MHYSPFLAGDTIMIQRTRRGFLRDVGAGVVAASVGSSLAADLGFSTAFADDGPERLTFGALTLNPNARTCTVNDQPVTLTPTEFAILETMLRHPGMVYSREALITEALNYDYAAYERTIDAHIRNLRRKIEVDIRDPQYIQTVFGVGYRFAERHS